MHRRYRSIARPRHLAGRHGAIALFGMSRGGGEAPICYQRTKMRRATAGARSESLGGFMRSDGVHAQMMGSGTR
jgi:hypothetical protein